MAGLDEDQLGPRLARGEQEAFVALFDNYGPRLYRAARVLLADQHDAEDAVQAVFVSLLGNRKSLASVNNWTAYLMTCLRHEAARFIAKRERRGERHTLEDLEIVAPIVESAIDEATELEQAIQKLPEEQRQVIRLKTDAGLGSVLEQQLH